MKSNIKDHALLDCIAMLQEFLDADDNEQAEAINFCIQQARNALNTSELPNPPQIIKVNETLDSGLDLRNPIHAQAYLRAAAHFLSSWPQEWSAETLCLALLAEDEGDAENLANQKKITPWDAIEKSSAFETEGGYWFLENIINNLAEDFVDFSRVFA